MLSLVLSLVISAVMGQNLCGRDCLSPCRMLAIACVRGIDNETPPINPGQLLTLMQCVIKNKDTETWLQKAPDCPGCINAELEQVTPEEKAECLGQEKSTCEKIESEDTCNKAGKPLVCGWIGGVCHNLEKPLADRAEFGKFISQFRNDDCRLVGGRPKQGKLGGKNLCRLSNKKRLRCGQMNKLARKGGLKGCEGECKNMCALLPNCRHKDTKSRCVRDGNFKYAFGADKHE